VFLIAYENIIVFDCRTRHECRAGQGRINNLGVYNATIAVIFNAPSGGDWNYTAAAELIEAGVICKLNRHL
jgi:hypothetical protein